MREKRASRSVALEPRSFGVEGVKKREEEHRHKRTVRATSAKHQEFLFWGPADGSVGKGVCHHAC